MNVTEALRNQASKRWILIAVAAAVADLLCGWAIAPALLLFILIFTPMIAGVVAYFAARSYEWTKLGIGEDYGKAAFERQQQMERKELRETLDTIGQEALDEVEAAIARREEGKSDG
jgi:hypothetical protein